MAERLGINLSKVDIKRYSDGEINIEVLDEARGKEVFLIQVRIKYYFSFYKKYSNKILN